MQDDITAFVGLDVHKGFIAIAVAGPGARRRDSSAPVLALPAARRPRDAFQQDLRLHRS